MATISVENAVVKGHPSYLSEVNFRKNVGDPHVKSVINAQLGSIVEHLPVRDLSITFTALLL